MKKILFPLLVSCIFSCQSVFAADYFELGKAAYARKDYNQANVYFVQALTQNPNDANCRYYYAQTLVYLKNYEQAAKEYGYVIQLAPNSVAADYAKQALCKFSSKPQQAAQQNKQSVGSNDNYIKKAVTSEGELMVWDLDRMPLKIYVDNSLRVNNAYVEAAKSALSAWESALSGLISFTYINDPSAADVKIVFAGIAKKTDNQLLGFTQHNSANGYINKVQVTLYTIGPNYKNLPDASVYNVALHEFGHMLGIWGHSDDKTDIMFASSDPNNQNRISLSEKDKNTARALYEIDKNPYSTGVNSINKILGSKYNRMEDKLQQDLAYIKDFPANPIGYVNLGNTYKAMNKEYDAMTYYKKALELDPNNLSANQIMANIYFNRNDLKNAEIYYKNLMRIEPKNPHAYCDLINLYIKNNKIPNANTTLSNILYRNPAAKNEACVKSLMSKLGRK